MTRITNVVIYYLDFDEIRHVINLRVGPGITRQQILLAIGRNLEAIEHKAEYYYVTAKILKDDGEIVFRTYIGKQFLHEWCRECEDWVSVKRLHSHGQM